MIATIALYLLLYLVVGIIGTVIAIRVGYYTPVADYRARQEAMAHKSEFYMHYPEYVPPLAVILFWPMWLFFILCEAIGWCFGRAILLVVMLEQFVARLFRRLEE